MSSASAPGFDASRRGRSATPKTIRSCWRAGELELGTKQPIPNRKDPAEIAVRLVMCDRMVDKVQVEGDHARPQQPLQPSRQPMLPCVMAAAANTASPWLITTIPGMPSASTASQ